MPDAVFAFASGALFVAGMASIALAAETRNWRFLAGYVVSLAAACALVVYG